MDNTWTQTSTMPRDVYGGSPAYHPAWGMIMSGGFSSYDKVLITEDAQVRMSSTASSTRYKIFDYLGHNIRLFD